MTERITAMDAKAEFGQIVERAVGNNDRFLVERDGEPAVLILSVTDFVNTIAPAPDWLEDFRDAARNKDLDKLTEAEIDAEIDATRLESRERRNCPGA